MRCSISFVKRKLKDMNWRMDAEMLEDYHDRYGYKCEEKNFYLSWCYLNGV